MSGHSVRLKIGGKEKNLKLAGMFEVWASLEMNFTRKTYTLEVETSVIG